jgi:hypothetical protein
MIEMPDGPRKIIFKEIAEPISIRKFANLLMDLGIDFNEKHSDSSCICSSTSPKTIVLSKYFTLKQLRKIAKMFCKESPEASLHETDDDNDLDIFQIFSSCIKRDAFINILVEFIEKEE